MKSKKLWLIVLAVFMCLAACLVGCSENTVEPTALRITNKTELRAEWFEGGADRTLLIDIPPEISEKDIRVTSSNPSVIEADGMTLKAKSAGIAKITVIADDESDSVNITVKQAPSEIAIVNKSALEKIVVGESKTLEYAIKPDLFDAAGARVEIVSSNTGVVTVNGNTVTAVAQGSAVVTVSTFGFTDSVDISAVALSAPAFGEATEVKGAVNTNIELPVTALSCDGADLREYVTATCSDGITFDKNTMTVKATVKGSHTVKLDVADPRDEGLTASVTLTVNTYRNVFANVNGYGMVDLSAVSYEEGKQFAADEEQVAFFDRWDGTWAAFDAEPGKIYYSEFTINSDGKPDWSTFYGATHSVKADPTRYLTGYIDRGAAETREPEYEGEDAKYRSGARAFRVKDFDFVNDSNCWEMHQGNHPRTQIIYADGIYRFRDIDKLESFPCKIATARIGDFFYYFVNDDFVFAVTNKYFADKDTVPGYFQQSGIKTDISNIVWLTGDAAKARFDALTDNGSKLMTEFAPNDWWKTENEASEHISHSDAAALGANYAFDTDTLTGENKGIVTPYIFFDGNFTVEWEYTFDAATTAVDNDWNRYMGLEARHAHDDNDSWSANYGNNPAFLFGACRYDGSDGKVCATVKPFSKNKPNVWDPESPTRVEDSGDWFAFDGEMKLKFSVSRICTADANNKPLAKYTFTISRPDGTQRSVWTYDDHGALNWISPCEPVILLWKNRGVKGAYSNIKWSVPEQSLSISNKTELTARWAAGDSARTVDVSVLGLDDATVSSSDPTVISVSGKTLTPLKAGTATITAKSGGFTDSVTITVIPALESVAIANEDALTAEWKDDSTDKRTVQITLSPAEYYTLENTTVTVTSSDTSVIKAEGFVLSVVGAGKSTITVTALGKTDTVEIVVSSSVPVIVLDSTDIAYVATGDEFELPTGEIMKNGVTLDGEAPTVSCDNNDVTIKGGKLTASTSGEYKIKYSYTGALDVEFTVRVYRKAIASVYAEGDAVVPEYKLDENSTNDTKQTLVLDTTKNTYAQFNMPVGKTLYAEATFVVAPQGGNNNFYGIYGAKQGDATHYIAAMTDRSNDKSNEWTRAVKVVEFDTTAENWTSVDFTKYWMRNVFQYGQKIVETAADRVTVALARTDDFFYMFIDGQIVMGFKAEYYNGADMVFGVFQKNAVKNTEVTAMSYLAGDDAKAKLDLLTKNGNDLLGEYRPNGWWDNENSAADHISSSTEADKGVNFTYDKADSGENAGIVTPNIYLDGDFTFEWEYKFASGTTSGNWNKYMRVELRGAGNYSDWGVRVTATAQNNNGNNLCIGANINASDGEKDLGGAWLNDENYAGQYKFAISRKCGDGNAVTFTFKVWKHNGSDYEEIQTKTWSNVILDEDQSVKEYTQLAGDFGAANSPAIVVIKNVNVAGEFTNIKWSASAAQAETV